MGEDHQVAEALACEVFALSRHDCKVEAAAAASAPFYEMRRPNNLRPAAVASATPLLVALSPIWDALDGRQQPIALSGL